MTPKITSERDTVPQNPNILRTETICRCGRKAELRVGTRDFDIGTRKITLHNLPYFWCSRCEKAIYDANLNVDEVLKYAYQNSLVSIDWNQY